VIGGGVFEPPSSSMVTLSTSIMALILTHRRVNHTQFADGALAAA
jgi:hypothetical protein